MVAVEERIRHVRKKIDKAVVNEHKTRKDANHAEEEIREFERELEEVANAERQFEGSHWQ
jgi:hypothetical protein